MKMPAADTVTKPRFAASGEAPFSVALLGAGQLEEAERAFRLAFGTFLGLPDPLRFMGEADLVRPRWRRATARNDCTQG